MTLTRLALAGAIAAVLLLALAPTAGVVRAHPHGTVTTVLQPGYNMAGWIEPETGVADLFEAIPELEAVYAWDAETGRFLAAYAGSPQPDGNLESVTPGMGLWLWLDGDEPFTWTRTAAPDPSAGLVSLHEGWNLVAWAGSEGARLEDAFAALDDDLQVALTWDTEAGWFAQYLPGSATAADNAGRTREGGAFWVQMSSQRHWLQPGSFEPGVEFYGDFPAERKAEIRAETRSVVTWFAERYGLLEPGFELYVGADRDSLTQARREVLGRPNPSYVLCGRAVNLQVFLADWCITATHDLTSPLAHEYFHVLQTHLVALTPAVGTVYVADWLLEGTAEYAAFAYAIAQGETTAEEVERAFQDDIIGAPTVLDGLAAGIFQLDSVSYLTAAFAVQHLVDQTEEAAVIEFFELLPALDGWEAAFTRAFGLSPAAFSSALSDYVEGLRPPPVDLRTVHVTVNDPDGNPFWEWNGRPVTVGTYHYDWDLDQDFYSPRSDLSETGGTLLLADNDNYRLNVQAACTVVGGDFFQSVYYSQVGRYMNGGSDNFVVAGEDVAVTINLDRWPGQYNINCHTGDRYQLSGRVAGEGGELRGGYRLSVHPDGEIKGYLSAKTDATGAFALEVPDGYAYKLTIYDSCERGIGWYHEGEGIVGTQLGLSFFLDGRDTQPTLITVSGADVSGIEIVIPSSREADDC